MNREEHIQELIILYSLGLLEGNELQEVRNILRSGDKKYLYLLEEIYTTSSTLSFSLDDEPLSPDLKNKIMNNINHNSSLKPSENKVNRFEFLNFGLFKLTTAFACAILIFLGYSNYQLNTTLKLQKEEIKSLKTKIEKNSGMMDFFYNNNVKVIKLKSLKENINLDAKIFWNLNSNNAILYVVDMPKLNEGKTYQFWTHSDKGMESMGTFDPKNNNMFEFNRMPKIEKTKTLYISIEPKGGMPNITGETIVVNDI